MPMLVFFCQILSASSGPWPWCLHFPYEYASVVSLPMPPAPGSPSHTSKATLMA
eukprot:c18025_g2_i1 orf=3-161(-)